MDEKLSFAERDAALELVNEIREIVGENNGKYSGILNQLTAALHAN